MEIECDVCKIPAELDIMGTVVNSTGKVTWGRGEGKLITEVIDEITAPDPDLYDSPIMGCCRDGCEDEAPITITWKDGTTMKVDWIFRKDPEFQQLITKLKEEFGT